MPAYVILNIHVNDPDLFEEYKIQRAAMPDDLVPQIASIRRLIAAMGVPALGCESFEADDVLERSVCGVPEENALGLVAQAKRLLARRARSLEREPDPRRRRAPPHWPRAH